MSLVGKAKYTVKSYSEGSYVDGLYSGSVESSRTVWGSLQPLSGEDLKRLPEGLDSSRTLKFYCLSKLKTSDQGEAPEDVLVHEGSDYAIYKSQTHGSPAPKPHGKYWVERRGTSS